MQKQKNSAGIWLTAVLVLLMILMLVQSDLVRESAAAAMRDCGTVIIPVLFPLAVLSALLIGSRAFAAAAGRLMRPLCKRLRFSEEAGCAILIGFLCGFPLGSNAVCRLYQSGRLGKEEADRLLALCHNTGPSFIVGYIGAALFDSIRFGIFLYMTEILSAILLAFVAARKAPRPLPHPPKAASDGSISLSAALRDSAAAMLTVAASVVFFRTLSAVLGGVIPCLALPIPRAVLLALLECTSGVGAGAATGGAVGFALAGFSLGFSGAAVLSQAAAAASDAGLSIKPCLAAKLRQGLISAFAAVLFTLGGAVPASKITPVTVDYRLLTAFEVALLTLALIIPSVVEIIMHRCRRANSRAEDAASR